MSLSTLGALFLIHFYAEVQGGLIKTTYENGVSQLLVRDPHMGFKNNSHVTDKLFGNIVIETNDEGFRGSTDYTETKKKGTTRIVGLGDSVMWGTRVNEHDTFLNLIGVHFQQDQREVETINAGTVGFSTLQEWLFYKRTVAKYEADILLVNYCNNDLYPTEGNRPYNKAAYENWFSTIYSLDFERLAPNFLKNELRDFENRVRNPRSQSDRLSLLIETPILLMAQLARRHNTRLIYLFLDNPRNSEKSKAYARRLQGFLSRHEIEFIDFEDVLKEENQSPPGEDFEMSTSYRLFSWIGRTQIPAQLSVEWLDPLPALKAIKQLKYVQSVHERRNFIDPWHPSLKGNQIIADKVYDYLNSGL